MCINSVKETCFSQKYQKWIYLILEINSSIVFVIYKLNLILVSPHLDNNINEAIFLGLSEIHLPLYRIIIIILLCKWGET